MMREENSTETLPTDNILLSSEPVFNYQSEFVHKAISI